MKLLPDDFKQNSEYQLFKVLKHADLHAFVRQYLKLDSWIIVSFLIFHIYILLFIACYAWRDVTTHQVALFEDVIIAMGIGFWVALFVAFFIHELIHLLAYKILGAKSATIKFQKMMFLALADNFVVDRGEFYFLAILPFLVITPSLIVLLLFLKAFWFYVVCGILFLHTAGCSGDFALINYFYKNRHIELLTFDSVQSGETYFYVKVA